MARRGPLPVGEACECVRQAALRLQHAHDRGLVHRDVKLGADPASAKALEWYDKAAKAGNEKARVEAERLRKR